MLGDTPQPGETPRNEGDPWSFADPDAAWWRGETDRSANDPSSERPRHPRRRSTPRPATRPQSQPPQGGTGVLLPPGADRPPTGEAAEAYAAGARDAAEQLDPAPRAAGAPTEAGVIEVDPVEAAPVRVPAADAPPAGPALDGAPATEAPAAATPPAATPPPAAPPPAATPPAATLPAAAPPAAAPPVAASAQAPAAASAAAQPAAVERHHDQPDPHRYDPMRPPAGHTARQSPATVAADVKDTPGDSRMPEPDVMMLPEPDARNRPTVPLDRGAVPGQSPVRRPRQGGAHVARPAEPLPPPTGSPITDARLERLENSPFWRDPVDDTIEVPPGEDPARRPDRPRHSHRHAGRPISAQLSLVALALVSAFFAWVSAEPFWLAVGHGDTGYATTTQCTGSGVTQRCVGQFAAADGRYTITRVTLLGVEGAARQTGVVTEARMVSPDSRQAYIGGTGPLLQLRWLLGFGLVLLCGYTIAGVTKARRLETSRARRGAVLLSLAGPLALLAGFLAAAY